MKFVLNKDKLLIQETEYLNSGSVNYYEIPVEYDESWNNLSKEAILIKEGESKGTSIAVINNKIFIDQDIKGAYSIGFVGYTIENNVKTYQISTRLKTLFFAKGAGEIEVTNAEDVPTPTEWEIYIAQIQSMIDGLEEEIPTKYSDLINDNNTVQDNNYVHTDNNFTNGYKENIDNNTITRHTHDNKVILDGITVNDISNWNNKQDAINDLSDIRSGASKGSTAIQEEIDPTVPSYVKNITQTNITNWNNKAELSDIPDVSNFITKTVNDLTNYYLKSQTYTQAEVNNLIGAIQQFHYEIVQTLPTTGANNILYLVPKTATETQNVYDEYVYANSNWEKIGDTQIDLTGYAKETWVNTQINTALENYTTTENLTTLLNAKQNNITSSNKLSSDLVDDTNNTNKFVTSTEKTTWNNKSNFSGDYNDLSNKPTIPTVPTNVSAFTNDAGYLTQHQDISGKQDTLVSGTNIKTINNQSILGSGNINLQDYLGKTNLYDTEEKALDLNALPVGKYYLKHNSSTGSFWIKATYKGSSQIPVTRTKQITLFPNISSTRVIQNTIILYIDKEFDENTTSLTAIGSITETYEDSTRTLCNKFQILNLTTTAISIGNPTYENFNIEKRTILYNNDSGSTQTITLSDSAANYDYMEIYFTTNDGNSNYTKITNPNGKYAVLFSNDIESSTVVWFKMKNIEISGTNITIRNSKAIKIINNSSSQIYEDSSVIKIIKVIGITNSI